MNLFVASRERKVLVEEDISCADEDSVSSSFVTSFDGLRWTFCEETGTASTGNRSKSIPASVLLRKLRWSTLGLQFDWAKVIPNFIIFFSISNFKMIYRCPPSFVSFQAS